MTKGRGKGAWRGGVIWGRESGARFGSLHGARTSRPAAAAEYAPAAPPNCRPRRVSTGGGCGPARSVLPGAATASIGRAAPAPALDSAAQLRLPLPAAGRK